MNPLKRICRILLQLASQAGALPQTIRLAFQQRRQQVILAELEAERLDRIRNPSKYLGR